MSMTKKAIVLPYMVSQNEPSSPSKDLVDVPLDETLRDIMLGKLWYKHFNRFNDIDLNEVSIDTDPTYGDISIGDGVCALFLTYLNEK